MAQTDGSLLFDTKIDTKDFESGMKKIEKSSKSAASTLAAEFRKQGMSQSEAMKKAWAEIKSSGESGSNAVKKSLENVGTEGKKAAEKIENSADSAGKEVKQDFDEIKNSAKKSATSASKDFDESFKKIKDGASKAAKAVGTGLVAGIGASLKMGSDFEEAMSSVSAISMATADEYEMLSSAARKMGEETKYSATQAANALEYLSLAGYSAEESVEALPKVLNLAAAGGMDLAYASDLLTDSMAVMGLGIKDMDNFSDQLAMAASKSNTSVQQLGEAVLIAGGQAKLAGMDTVQMNTALGILADNGIKGAEGGTALRNALKNLYTPTSSAAKAMKALGVKTSDAKGNLRSAQDVLQDLNKSLSKLSEADRIDAMSQIFDTRTIAAGTALLKNSGERWNELSGYLKDCDGAAAQMAETMNDNLKGKLTLLGSAAEGLAIAFYDGIQEPLKNAVDEGASKISELTRSLSGGDLSGALANIGNLLGNTVSLVINLANVALPPLISTLGFVGEHFETLAVVGGTALAVIKGYTVVTAISGKLQALSAVTATYTLVSKASAASNAAETLTITPLGLAFGVLTRQINLATAAQIAHNAAEKASMAGLVVAGLTAVAGAAILAYKAITKETEAEKAHREAVEEHAQSLQEDIDAMNDRKQAFADSIMASKAEFDNAKNLADELFSLADANGEVSDANRGRAQFILGELNDALGTEYGMNGNLIESYDELRDSVYQTIEAKKAEAYLSAYEEDYTEAMKSKIAARKDLTDAELLAADALKEQKRLTEEVKIAQDNYNEAYSKWLNSEGVNKDQAYEALIAYSRTLENTEATLSRFEQKNKDAFDAVDNARAKVENIESTITGYEDAMTDFNNQNYDGVISALDDLGMKLSDPNISAQKFVEGSKEALGQLGYAYTDALTGVEIALQNFQNKPSESTKTALDNAIQTALDKKSEYEDAGGVNAGGYITGFDGVMYGADVSLEPFVDKLKAYEDVIGDSGLEAADKYGNNLIGQLTTFATPIGSMLENVGEKFKILNNAQDDLEKQGSLTKESIKNLAKAFPDIDTESLTVENVKQRINDLKLAVLNAKGKTDNLATSLSNLPSNKTITVTVNTVTTGNAKKGYATGVKNAPRGLAVVNEKGRELIKSKDGSFRYVDSGTSALTYLNQGDTVYTAAQSKRMLNSANVKIPGFAGGLNNYSGNTAMSSISIDLRFGDVSGGLEDALLSGQGKIKKAGEKLGENAIDGFNDSFDGETEKSGQDFVDGFTDGINGSQSEAVSVSGDMAYDSTNQLSSAASEAMGIGSQLASNFAAGISSGESAVASAAGGLASTAIAALSAAAGQALGIGLTSAGTLDIQIVDSNYKLSADVEKMKKEMDLSLSLGAISLEDYTKSVTYWRDNYVKKYTQQWWDATKTIVNNNQTVANEAKKTAEDNAKAAQQAAEKAQKEAEDRRKKQIEEELNALQHQHDMELISDEQYINGKEAIYNKYYKGDKDKQREIEKARRDLEEQNYLDQREKSFNNIEFWRKMGYITESQYWEEYKRLTEMYYDPNRDRDREEYRSKISAYYDHEIEERDKARQKEQDRIEWLYSKGLISAKEYYDSMTRYRDRWFEKGTDEWEDFNKTVIENLDFSSVISEKLDAVLDKQKSMRDKLYDSVSLYQTYEPGLKIGGEAVKLNVATNWSFEKQKLQNYFDTFNNLKNRVDMPTELLDDIRNMSRDEGMQFMQVLQNMDDDELKKYIEDYKSYFDLANKGSEDMYADDAVQTAKDTAAEIAQQLKDAGFEVPDTFFELGKTSVKRFGEGFEEQLKTIKEKMNSSVASALVKYLPSFVADGKPTSGDVTVVTNNNYNITAKDESAKGQMDAIQREQDYRDMN
jgi:TP901 family phage tail tape measure protein